MKLCFRLQHYNFLNTIGNLVPSCAAWIQISSTKDFFINLVLLHTSSFQTNEKKECKCMRLIWFMNKETSAFHRKFILHTISLGLKNCESALFTTFHTPLLQNALCFIKNKQLKLLCILFSYSAVLMVLLK